MFADDEVKTGSEPTLPFRTDEVAKSTVRYRAVPDPDVFARYMALSAPQDSVGIVAGHDHGASDARSDLEFHARHVAGACYRGGDPFHDSVRVIPTVELADHCEFVTSEPAHQVPAPGVAEEAGGHALQDTIAGMVAEFVIHLFESVEVGDRYGMGSAGSKVSNLRGSSLKRARRFASPVSSSVMAWC